MNQYYVDKFRIAADFAKGAPATTADASIGRNAKGGVLVPKNGIPQEVDPAIAYDGELMEDPRIAESEGSLYFWDKNYDDPKFAPSTYADLDDEDVAEDALIKYRGAMAEERTMMLTKMDFGAAARVQRIKQGISEPELLTLDGALDAAYARLQKVCDPPTLGPTGVPQTEIPGMPYMGSCGAMDFIEKPGEDVAFWKEDSVEPTFKRPSGEDTPDLPYGVSPTVDQLKAEQKARGILPSSA